MSYQKNDNGTVTISATLRDEEMSGFLLAWGMMTGAMQGMDPRITWSLISMMNRFMEGNPEFVQYEVPADRTQPFQPKFLHPSRHAERTEAMKELTSEELLRRLTAEMVRLHDSGAGMRLEIAPETAFAVVACVQLALRHPQANLGPSARLVEQFIEYVRAKFEPRAPAIAEAIRRGNEPVFDEAAQ